MNRKYKRTLIIILVVSMLINMIAISISVLHNYNDYNDYNDKVIIEIPGNIIDKEDDSDDIIDSKNENPVYSESNKEAEVIKINKYNSVDNKSFNVLNMLPGDYKTEYYCIRVSYKDDITLKYSTYIKEDDGNLSDALNIKVKLINTNEILYDGLIRDIPKSIDYSSSSDKAVTEDFYYEIVTYLDTSVGNEYQDKNLLIDFEWGIDEDNLENPYTVDNIMFWIFGGISSVLLIILIIPTLKREGEDENE